MDYSITLAVPEDIYQAAQQQATRQQLTVEALLSQSLSTLWRSQQWQDSPVEPLAQDERKMQQEVGAYQRLHPELVKQYLGQYVAIYQGQLVDHDWDEDALMRRRLEKFPNAVVMIDKVEEEAQRELFVPSLRWVPA